MPPEPVPADPGPDEDLAWLDRDPMTAEEREAALDRICEEGEPPELDDYGDYEPLTPEELAEIRQAAADELLAVEAATTGRRGPGQPGSARIFPGESASPAAGFGPGMALDVLPGGPGLAAAAGAAVDDGFAGMSEGELIGIMCAWDRVEAHAAARKLAAIAELGRRNPGPQDEEFAADQLACALAESRGRAYDLLDLADHLDTRLPGTKAMLHEGTLGVYKARLIAAATALLDPDEARAAEDKVLDRAARLTPGALRAAIARAVMEVAPDKAKERREQATKDARVERWVEDSGNAALMGCELPPDEVLAADQRITAWAHELKKAGLDGGMDQLRARAYLDLLLGTDSRPRSGDPQAADPRLDRPGQGSPGGPGRSGGSADGAVPAGFVGRVTLTAPLATVARLDSPSPPLAATARRAGTAPGGCALPDPGPTSSSRSTRSRPTPATTGTKPTATTPAPGCGTCPRSGTPPAPAPSAAGPPPSATWSTTPPLRRADARACATPTPNAATTTEPTRYPI